jgi:hypothetical protein
MVTSYGDEGEGINSAKLLLEAGANVNAKDKVIIHS